MNSDWFSGMQWWTPIPWLLAVIGIGVTIIALRRSRYAAVQFHYISSHGIQSIVGGTEVWDLTVEILCTGADIYGARLFLECHYRRARYRTTWPNVLALEFSPTSLLPNPIKNGQVIQFELTDDHLKRALELNAGYSCLPSYLPRRRTRLALYGSGDRLIATNSSRAFHRALRAFESRSASYVRTGDSAVGWSHQYVQPPVERTNQDAQRET